MRSFINSGRIITILATLLLTMACAGVKQAEKKGPEISDEDLKPSLTEAHNKTPPAVVTTPTGTPPKSYKHVTFGGGDGLSQDNAVKILGAKNHIEGIKMEYTYLNMLLGPKGAKWTLVKQSLVKSGGHKFDVMQVKVMDTGQVKTWWFDLDDFFGKW